MYDNTHFNWRDLAPGQALNEDTGDLMWAADLEHRLLTFNRAFAEHIFQSCGIRIAVGMHAGDILPGTRFFEWPFMVARTLKEGSFRTEYSLADGRMLQLTLNAIVQDGRNKGVSIVGKDITDQKRMQAALRKSDEKFAKAFSLSPIITTISDFNDNDRLIEVNRAFEEIVGYSRGEAIGRTSGELRLWNHIEEFNEAVRLYRANGSLRGFEYRFRTKSGDVRTGLISAAVTELGGMPYVLAATIDITERKRAEAEKAALESQLRQSQKMETVGRLAGGIAHDFNNLLMVINGYSQTLLNNLPRGGQDWLQAKQIQEAGELAASLTRQLLTLSSNQSVEPKPLIVNDIVTGFQGMLVRLIGEDVEVKITLSPDLDAVMADPDVIHQVLLNLIVNAREAMPGGGALTIATRNADVDEYGVAGRPDITPGAYVVLDITDSGIGMNSETIEYIFEPFFTTKGKGGGLGLATVYGSIKQSGGWIDVSSNPGAGTTFRIYLPALSSARANNTSVTKPAVKRKGGETILVVEDNDAVRDLVVSILESFGYNVLEASGSSQAFEITAGHSGEIHLLLTDLMLRGGMNGNALSKQLVLSRPRMKVLFMSGYPADTLGDRGVPMHRMSYITKPFLPMELEEKIREALSPPVRAMDGRRNSAGIEHGHFG